MLRNGSRLLIEVAIVNTPCLNGSGFYTDLNYGPSLSAYNMSKKLLSVQCALTQILLSVRSELINILLSMEGKCLWYSISSLIAVVLAWFNMERVLIGKSSEYNRHPRLLQK